MPLFRIQVFKSIIGSDREWSNTYIVQAVDLAGASAAAGAIGAMERTIHLDNVMIVRALVSTVTEDDEVFATVGIGLAGERDTAADGNWLPLFNTARVDINVAGGGRPSRKYYRLPLLESDQQAGFIDPTLTGLLSTKLTDLIDDLVGMSASLVDEDTQAWITVVPQSKVQMRQLHRKRKKAVVSP